MPHEHKTKERYNRRPVRIDFIFFGGWGDQLRRVRHFAFGQALFQIQAAESAVSGGVGRNRDLTSFVKVASQSPKGTPGLGPELAGLGESASISMASASACFAMLRCRCFAFGSVAAAAARLARSVSWRH
jgi:hypothetical protein